MSLQIETASNVAWQLTLAAPSGISPRGRIEVMTAAGAWEDLSLDALSRIVVAAGDPTNPTVRHIRFRVHNAADIPVLERLHLQMETAS